MRLLILVAAVAARRTVAAATPFGLPGALLWGLAGPPAWAQAPAALANPAPPAAAASAPAPAERVQVTGNRQSDEEQRRRSTAAKIIIGREQIEQYGDSSLGEVLKRLPGVTTDGRPGRGGGPRMRGLGGGYTQILVDGERVQGGLSLDSIDPDQVERIEILRAPTAETGARAIAGTINVITRDGFTKRLNDLKLGLGMENGRVSPGLSWTRDDNLGAMNYNVTLSLNERRTADVSQVHTTDDATQPALTSDESRDSDELRRSLHLNARLRWKLDGGGQLMLMPLLIVADNESQRRSRLSGTLDPSHALSLGRSEGGFSLLRLNGMGRTPLPDGGWLELRGGVGRAHSESDGLRREFDAAGNPLRQRDDASDNRETTAQLTLKYSRLLAESHNLVAGLEGEAARRNEAQTTLLDGQPQLTDFGTNLSARSTRLAAYAQDEWALTPQWALHAGLRWEGIRTRGEGSLAEGPQDNRSSVWTPLLHAVWKFEPQSRDQLRMSLTRSYRAPTLQNLLGRPSLSARYPVPGANTPTSPDRAGNPGLSPELATGLDLALERYLPGGGMLSASLFHRRIQDLMRTVTALEDVSWSDVPRWVARPQNIGAATTQGLELEAKFRLTELVAEAPALDIRANASLFRSRVASVPGPDNRLDQQPAGTANLGADYRLPGWPLTVGANLNWTPGYTTRLSENQWLIQSRKRVVDAYALWTLSPQWRLRLSANNLGPEDAVSTSAVAQETAVTRAETALNWRLQLEIKL